MWPWWWRAPPRQRDRVGRSTSTRSSLLSMNQMLTHWMPQRTADDDAVVGARTAPTKSLRGRDGRRRVRVSLGARHERRASRPTERGVPTLLLLIGIFYRREFG